MPYKTILVHVDQSSHAEARIRIAAMIAKKEGAHLIGTAMTGISRYVFEGGAANAHDPTLMHHVDYLRNYARQALDGFEKLVSQAGLALTESRLLDDDAASGLVLQSRYADLIVIGQTDPKAITPGVMPDFPETVIMHSMRPVLIVPYAGHYDHVGTHPLIAWDGSATAMQAITAALPVLTRAHQVDLVIFNAEDQDDVHGKEPGADIGLYLARHGVNINVIKRKVDGDNGQALLSLAADIDADLIIMGGYGHSRFREIMLGGVTRTILSSMTLPVIMAH